MVKTEAIKRRIQNTEDLLSIVTTMKTLAAINIRQYEKAVESLADYYETIEMGFQVLLRNAPQAILPANEPPHHQTGVVIFGSDQGMCGQFNEQIANMAFEELARLGFAKSQRTVLTLGARITAILEAVDHPLDDAFPIPGSVGGITPLIQDIVMKIDTWRAVNDVKRVIVFHNRPVSGATFQPHMLNLLPLNLRRLRRLADREWQSRVLPTFTMEPHQLLSTLTHQYLFVSIYRAFAESLMSENASRIATMQSAERNIEDQLDELQSRFHQQRQQSITEELLDIMSGFEALSTP